VDGKLDPIAVIDPDRMTVPPAPGTQSADAQRFVCSTCGGRMTYTPDGQSLTCEYCESRQHLGAPTTQVKELPEGDFFLAMATIKGHASPVDFRAFACQGCGASFILPPSQMSLICPYCASTYVIRQAETRQLMAPNALVPFLLDEKKARSTLITWFKTNGFTQLPRVGPGHGYYLPVWSFDLGGTLNIGCEIHNGDRWIPQHEEYPLLSRNVLVLATHRFPDSLGASIQSYNMDELVPFDPRFLANWLAETYQISIGDASLDAREKALAEQKNKVMYSYIQPMRNLTLDSSRMQVESYQLLLLPGWITYYMWENKRYEVFINGQNGKVLANKPGSTVGRFFKNLFHRS
jgi:DNA-directed RNA polymerase subunit RPC12/RpoP